MVTTYNHQRILFLSTGNSVRSIFAEYLMKTNKIGRNRFRAYSAGSQPTGIIHPCAIRVLRDHYKIDIRDARSKSWDEFRSSEFDMIITVCDRARESCPMFPGQPRLANWNIPNPEEGAKSDDQKLLKFREVAQQIQARIQLLCLVPAEKLGHLLTQSARQEEASLKVPAGFSRQ